MTPDALRELVRTNAVAALVETQRNGDRESPPITDATIPYYDLPGFDSLSGVEAAVILSGKLAVDIHELAFLETRTGEPMKVGEIVDALVQKHGGAIAAAIASSGTSATGRSESSSAA